MTPGGLIMIVLIVRAVLRLAEQGRAAPAGEGGSLGLGAKTGLWLWVIFAWFLLLPALFAAVAFALEGSVLGLLAAVAILALLATFLTTRYVLVPEGLSDAAYYLSSLPSVTWSVDRRGGACLMAAWALLRRKRDSAGPIERLEARLAKATPLRGAGIVAEGLLLAKRGDLAGARTMLKSVELLDERVRPVMALRIAREWRAVDALERGGWDELDDLALLPGPKSRLGWLLGALAGHRVGRKPLTPVVAWTLWLIASRRGATRELVARTLAEPVGIAEPRPPEVMDVFLDEGDPLAAAMRFQVALRGRSAGAVAGADLARLGHLWDRALDALNGDRLRARAVVLGAIRFEETRRAIEAQVEEELAALVAASKVPLAKLAPDPDEHGLMARVVRRVRNDLLRDLEVAAAHLRSRTEDQRRLPVLDEWREWLVLEAATARALARTGEAAQRLAIPSFHSAAVNFAVWLYNDRKEHAIGQAMFLWVRDRSKAASYFDAVELDERNATCTPF